MRKYDVMFCDLDEHSRLPSVTSPLLLHNIGSTSVNALAFISFSREFKNTTHLCRATCDNTFQGRCAQRTSPSALKTTIPMR